VRKTQDPLTPRDAIPISWTYTGQEYEEHLANAGIRSHKHVSWQWAGSGHSSVRVCVCVLEM
jgi:hypothetical protein